MAGLGVLLVPVVALAWYLGSPLFVDTVVDEPFPLSAGAELPPDMTQEEAEQIMAEEASRDVVVDEPMAMPASSDTGSAAPSGSTPTPGAGPTIAPTLEDAPEPAPTATVQPVPTATASPTPSAPQAIAVKAGEFRDADQFHRGSGRATLYRLSDNSIVLRLEDFMVTNGPELHVLLSTHPDPRSRAEVMNAGYVDLGDLKGNIGNQNYEVANGIDISNYSSVVIYCKPFHVIFSVAPLSG